MPATIDQLIINSPYEEPSRHWSYKRETRTFLLEEGRRLAGYVRASEHSKAFDDPGMFIELPLVTQIRKRFTKHVFVVAPGLTVKSRLQVLQPSDTDNYYDEFNIVPPGLHDKLRQGKVLIRNWHTLMPLDPNDGPKVVKKGAESNEAFTC